MGVKIDMKRWLIKKLTIEGMDCGWYSLRMLIELYREVAEIKEAKGGEK